MHPILALALALTFLSPARAAEPASTTVGELVERARSQAAAGDIEAAAASLGRAIEKKPDVLLHQSRAKLLSRLGKHKQATADYSAAMSLTDNEAQLAELHQARGVERFFDGQAKASVADFDAFLNENPQRAPYHWQRGLSQYYAGDFKAGREQFESHQKVNSRDVENAAWHFLCVARTEGVDKAREKFIPIEGDRRVPMAEVHQLFAGKAQPEAVIAAAREAGGSELEKRDHLCYAHLYLGLYFEALGEKKKSLRHMKMAATNYRMDHYMGKTAKVHWKLRQQEQEE